ncbi:hypothetical protein ACVR1G_08195 [Streptococcus dentasini]
MKELLTTGLFTAQKAGLIIAAGDPFSGTQNKLDELRGKAVLVGLAGLGLAGVVTLIIYGFAGQELKEKMKMKLGRIVLAAMGIGILPGFIMWCYTWTQQGF